MKKGVLVSLIVVCFIFAMTGCSKTGESDFSAMARFEDTDWGMTPQEVLKARSLSFDDVQIRDLYEGPQPSGYQVYTLVSEKEDLRGLSGLSATVTYWFAENYIPAAREELPPIGLEAVHLSFEDPVDFGVYMEKFDSEALSNLYFTAEDLGVSEELQQKISDFRARRNDGKDPAEGPGSEWANAMVNISFIASEEDGVFEVRYDAVNMALANFLAEQEDPYIAVMEKLNLSE